MRKIIYIPMFVLAFVLCAQMPATAGNVIVIANKGVGSPSLSKAEVQNIFLGRTVIWPDGKKINPAVLKGGTTHDSFLNTFLGKSANQFDTFWKQVIFTGKGRPPKIVGSDVEMVQYVSGTDGAVGYIDADTPHGDVKKVDVK